MKPFLYEGRYACYPVITVIEQNRSVKNHRLQEIILFDYAESTMGLGQVNFRKTSSFCEQGNYVNGVNMREVMLLPGLSVEKLRTESHIDIFDYSRWCRENKLIIKKHITPGAHICCAGEWEFGSAGDMMYAGVGIAVPADNKNAILFMECVGKTEETSETIIEQDVIDSIKAIGVNQSVKYQSIHVAVECKKILEDLGCAMVAIPYFRKERWE